MESNIKIHKVESEIGIKEIFMVIWKKKIIILTIGLIGAILSGVYSIFIVKPVYESSFNLTINMPETITTRYGEYTLLMTNEQQYIELLKSNLVLNNTIKDVNSKLEKGKKINLEFLNQNIRTISNSTDSKEQNGFNIIVSANSREDAKLIADTLYENYLQTMEVMINEMIISYFNNQYAINIDILKNTVKNNKLLLKKNEELLEVTPKIIYQKDTVNEIYDQLDADRFVVLDNIVNPDYIKLQSDILFIKQSINTDENTIEQYVNYLEDLTSDNKAISSYYKTDDFTQLETYITNVVDKYIYLASTPELPTSRTSPSYTKSIIAGAFLSAVLMILILLIKEFWFVKADDIMKKQEVA